MICLFPVLFLAHGGSLFELSGTYPSSSSACSHFTSWGDLEMLTAGDDARNHVSAYIDLFVIHIYFFVYSFTYTYLHLYTRCMSHCFYLCIYTYTPQVGLFTVFFLGKYLHIYISREHVKCLHLLFWGKLNPLKFTEWTRGRVIRTAAT